jgi:putative ABC transport system permease protein
MKKNKINTPSPSALRFLEWFCPPHLYEGIEGDLVESFEKDVLNVGAKRAQRRLRWSVLKFFTPGIVLRNKFSIQLFTFMMLHNYLTIAYRNVLKNKAFSFINIIGLGIGLAACILIFQFVSFELSYDSFNEKFDRIYRITNDRYQNGKLIQHGTITYPTVGPTLAKDYPEIEVYTRLVPGGEMNIKLNDKIFRGEDCFFVDENFLSVFTFPLLAGEPASALKDPYAIVLTEKVAKKYFDLQTERYDEVLGKTIYWGLDPQPYTITGVCTVPPSNSHLKFDVLVSYATFVKNNPDADNSWTWSDFWHYVVLKPGAHPHSIDLEDFSKRYFKGNQVSGSNEKFFLQPLSRAHLYSDFEYEIGEIINGKAVWSMLVVALFILLIAWINYINLTTSRALERAKEVGLRKVMGAVRTQLIGQFLLESVLITLLALILSIGLVMLLQPTFNRMLGLDLSLSKLMTFATGETLLYASLVVGCGILLAGFYPAFVLSSYHPITVLKGRFTKSFQGNFMRKGLVVFQFMASATLITGTLIVSKQLRFMNEADLGMAIDSTMIVRPPERTAWDSTFMTRVENYKYELSRLNGVTSVATSQNLPGSRLGRAFDVRLKDQASAASVTASYFGVDHDFLQVYKVPLVAGRYFTAADHMADWKDITKLILNVSAVKLLGMDDPQEAVGRQVVYWDKTWTVVGVVGDFHQESLKKPKEAIFFYPVYGTYNPTSIKIRGQDLQKTIAHIETTFRKFFPDNAFEYYFIEDSYNRQYQDEDRFGKIIAVFTLLAIIISCLGLIGLSSYTAIQRTKEIGIRKVLGASLLNIVSLLSLNFIKLVLLATMLALPIAYFMMNNWLEGYAYRTTIGWFVLAAPVLVILLIAMTTISFQVVKTAMTNPADTLKYE